jgi:hypothetical protein
MNAGERLRVGQRVRHRQSGIGLGTIVEDNGDPEDRGAYLVRYDNGEAFQTSRSVLDVLPGERVDEDRRQRPAEDATSAE